jgi:hypothetical protein
MLVRALAHESGVNFVSIKGPEVSIPVVPLPPHSWPSSIDRCHLHSESRATQC